MKLKIPPDQEDTVLYFIMMILMLSIALQPIGLPIPITDMTYKFYDKIEELKEGDYVLWHWDDPGNWFANNQVDIAIFKHLKQKILEDGVKLVCLTIEGPGGIMFIDRAWNIVGLDDLKYGVDWVWLGWLPGREAAYASVREDIWSAFKTDYYGAKLEDLPIMEKARNLQSFKIVGVSCNTSPDDYMRQYGGKGVPILVENGVSSIPLMLPYIGSGMMYAYMTTMKQCAEYEILTGFKGLPTRQMDAQSMGQIYLLGVIIVGNAVYWRKRLRGGEKK